MPANRLATRYSRLARVPQSNAGIAIVRPERTSQQAAPEYGCLYRGWSTPTCRIHVARIGRATGMHQTVGCSRVLGAQAYAPDVKCWLHRDTAARQSSP